MWRFCPKNGVFADYFYIITCASWSGLLWICRYVIISQDFYRSFSVFQQSSKNRLVLPCSYMPLTFDLLNFKTAIYPEWVVQLTWNKWIWFNIMLDLPYDLDLLPSPWPWSWIFKVKFWNSYIPWPGCPIDGERIGCESVWCWTHYMALTFDPTHELDLGLSRSKFEIVVFQEWMGSDLIESFEWGYEYKAVKGDMGKNRNIYVYLSPSGRILDYYVTSLI